MLKFCFLQWCIRGFCEKIRKKDRLVGPVAKNPRNGNWSEWSDWNSCSQTCNIGVRFRTRKCNNPPYVIICDNIKWARLFHPVRILLISGRPANGGKNCKGPSEDSQLCNTQPCPQWTDFRAEQCATIPELILSANLSSLTWLPWEPNNRRSFAFCYTVALLQPSSTILMTFPEQNRRCAA